MVTLFKESLRSRMLALQDRYLTLLHNAASASERIILLNLTRYNCNLFEG